jgi:hypothetical protein
MTRIIVSIHAPVDAVQEWPADITWPEPPELETQEAFAARIAEGWYKDPQWPQKPEA